MPPLLLLLHFVPVLWHISTSLLALLSKDLGPLAPPLCPAHTIAPLCHQLLLPFLAMASCIQKLLHQAENLWTLVAWLSLLLQLPHVWCVSRMPLVLPLEFSSFSECLRLQCTFELQHRTDRRLLDFQESSHSCLSASVLVRSRSC